MTPSDIQVAVVGCGHWGKNLIRNFYQLGFLGWVCDVDNSQLSKLKKQFRGLHTTTQFDDILANPAIDAVVLSTPSHTHYALAKKALMANKHVYVEKPAATSVGDVQELFTLADHHNRVFMVGHLLMYHPAVNRLKQLIQEGALGEIRYIESDRLNHNMKRPDRTVFWDLAPHDISMMMYLLDAIPEKVISVQGQQTADDGLVDIVHMELQFDNGVLAHIHNSWVHPFKQTKLLIKGSTHTAVMDDTVAMADKLRITPNDMPSEQDVPDLLLIEPLKLECQHFINCIRTGRQPKSDGLNGLQVVQVLEEAQRLLDKAFEEQGARPVQPV